MKEEINIGKVLMNILNTLIVKFFTLPWRIYKNALISLSNVSNDDSEESILINEYPIYLWLLSIFNALIAISYPIGLIGGLIAMTSGFEAFIGIMVGTYFIPLYLGLIRELMSVTLKTIYYLKKISNK